MNCQCECGLPDYYFVKVLSHGITTRSTYPTEIGAEAFGAEPRVHISEYLAGRTQAAILWVWEIIVEAYTKRELTNHADKLSALSGLAHIILESLGLNPGAYLAGNWQAQLGKGLLWTVRGPSQPRRYIEYHAPS